jgi:hypothetical protein
VERQHDVLFWHAERDQVIGNPTFCAIVLNPDLVILDIDVHEAAMYSVLLIPTHNGELVMVTDRVKDELQLDITVRWLELTVLFQHLLDMTAVVI